MTTLALDCSTKATGFAVFNDQRLVVANCITASSSNLYKRIFKMVDSIIEIVQKMKVDTIVMEEVIPDHAKNVNTFKALMYLQAAIHLQLYKEYSNIKIELVYPGTWRAQCGIHTGRGIKREELKKADIQFANNTYQLNITSDDTADAICIGHAFLHPKNIDEDLNWG